MQLYESIYFTKILDNFILNSTQNQKIGNLAIIQIGEDSSSNSYIKIKQNTAKKLGIKTKLYKLSESQDYTILYAKVIEIVTDKENSSVIIQLPLSNKNHYELLDLIPVEKDIDLLSKKAQKLFYRNKSTYKTPLYRATDYVLKYLKLYNKEFNYLVVGTGFLVGRPIYHLLENKNLRVSSTNDFKPSDATNKDVVILTAGKSNLVKGEYLKDYASVLDFGFSRIDNKINGDLDMKSKLDHLNYIVPSPKGMGPIVVRFLFLNHLRITALPF